MLRRLFRHMRQNAVAWLALFVAMGGTSAYAANTIGSTDIIDGEVSSADIKNQDIASADVKDQSLTTFDVSTFLGADVVDESLTGDDIKSGSITKFDIGTGEVDGVNVQNNSLGGPDLADGSLNDEDVGQATFVNFEGNIGTVATGFCASKEVTGINASGDHLVLTASQVDASPVLSYTAEYSANGSAWIKACNSANFDVNDGITHFNLLVIDAQ